MIVSLLIAPALATTALGLNVYCMVQLRKADRALEALEQSGFLDRAERFIHSLPPTPVHPANVDLVDEIRALQAEVSAARRRITCRCDCEVVRVASDGAEIRYRPLSGNRCRCDVCALKRHER